MSKKRLIWTSILVVAALVALYLYKEYNRTNSDLTNLKADIEISAGDLIKEFETGDSAANKKYLDKVIELTGNVKNLEKDDAGDYTIVIGDTLSMSSVRCLPDTNHRSDAAIIKENSTITIRGVCTGFIKKEMLGENG